MAYKFKFNTNNALKNLPKLFDRHASTRKSRF